MVQRRKPNRGRRSVPRTLPAPTGGLNGRDALGDMPPEDAFRMENWIPNNTSVDTRGGSDDWATGVPAAVESLEVYTGGAGSKMLAFGDGKIYDVTLGGAVGAALLSSRSSDIVTTAMFSNAGTQFLLIYSGADQPLSYDGTSLVGLTITGLTGSQNTTHSPMAFKGRVFIAQEDQLGFYYLGVGAIQGAASYFDLSQQSFKGGALLTQVSVSTDGGAGPQDYAVFVTTEGEYIVYSGTDPSNAATWALVGRYYGPTPIGRKGWFKFRSDVYFITDEGVLSLTEIRQLGQENKDDMYLTGKLGRYFSDAVRYRDTHGWTGVIYPRGRMLLINCPLTGSTAGEYTQFVMNTSGKDRWTQFRGWDALCFTVFNQRLYFGTFDGKVVLADEGFTDNGAAVNAVARQAWNTHDDDYGMGDANKRYHMVSFAVSADGAPALACTLNINYENDEPQVITALAPTSGAEWDLADWDVEDWAGEAATQHLTVQIGKFGYISSVWMKAEATASEIRWYASRILIERTKGVLFQ
jgi:hypothetical protein